MPFSQLPLDRSRIEAARREEHVAVEPQVGHLRDEALVVLPDRGEGDLDAFLPPLLGALRDTLVEEARDVRAFGTGGRSLGDDAPQPRGEARLRAGVARGAVRADAQQDRVAVAVLAQLLYRHRVPGRLALVPVLAARAAPEPRLARLARAAQSFVVHPGEHQDVAARGVLDDGGP